ncbi:hypothetical protein [Kribbella sp. NPDC051620]|uniref:hypothetical protein n=1 Tax=Kribbella sp. NPDC051620 TaxID=3364120 RepID=UPI003788BE77
MRIHRVLWWSFAIPIGLLGGAAAVASSSVLSTVTAFGLLALSLGTLSARLQSLDGEGQPSGPISAATVVRRGCLAGSIVVPLFGLGTLIGIAVLPLTLILAVTSPVMVSRWPVSERAVRSGSRIEARPAPTVDCCENTTPVLRELTDRDLCREWRRSYVELQRADSAEAKVAIAGLRQGVLDEFERRNLNGFDDWLASRACAASDPARFLLARPRRRRLQ